MRAAGFRTETPTDLPSIGGLPHPAMCWWIFCMTASVPDSLSSSSFIYPAGLHRLLTCDLLRRLGSPSGYGVRLSDPALGINRGRSETVVQ